MNIPRYWARATARVKHAGRTLELLAWGWSDDGAAGAERRAGERLRGLVERIARGEPLPRHYGYGARPLREEILEELRADGGLLAVVTRNGYGSLVLNAARALFVDVDFPAPRGGGLLSRLLGGAPRPEAAAEAAAARVREALAGRSGGFRLYRTAAGLRVMGTGEAFDPRDPVTEALMSAMGADPAFVQLCRAQGTFRARLTPKPWRCGRRPPPGTHPREDPRVQRAFAEWRLGYEEACADRATCRFLETIGDRAVVPEVRPVLELHDRATRAGQALPLA